MLQASIWWVLRRFFYWFGCASALAVKKLGERSERVLFFDFRFFCRRLARALSSHEETKVLGFGFKGF